MLWHFRIWLKNHKGGSMCTHPILILSQPWCFLWYHHWACGTCSLLHPFSKQSKFIKIKCACPLRGVVPCATCRCCKTCFWMWRIFCSFPWEGSIWSEWFVTHFFQLTNEMLQCAVNFNISSSAKQMIAVNFWEGLLRMGFKRTCLLRQSRFSLIPLFLLTWFYIPFNHIVPCYPEERK